MSDSFTINASHRHLMAERRIRTWLGDESRMGDGYVVFTHPGAEIEPYTSFLIGSGFCSMGAFSYSWSEMFPHVTVGRYCSIAHEVKFMGGFHPMSHVSTSSMFYDRQISAYRDALKDFGLDVPVRYEDETPHFPIIENDVWIGQGAMIGRGVTIGTGAVVAAGSVVTKNVEPYAIVAGNPARFIRYRFEEEVCQDLLESEWWRFALPQFAEMDFSQPKLFLRQLAERRSTMAEFRPLVTLGAEFLEVGSVEEPEDAIVLPFVRPAE